MNKSITPDQAFKGIGQCSVALHLLDEQVKPKFFDYVWCPTCGEVRDYIVDVLPVNEANKDSDWPEVAAQDIVCSECKFVICTFHEAKHGG